MKNDALFTIEYGVVKKCSKEATGKIVIPSLMRNGMP